MERGSGGISGGDSRQEAGRWPVLDAAQLDVLRRYGEPRREAVSKARK
jgi:hypothetical protein